MGSKIDVAKRLTSMSSILLKPEVYRLNFVGLHILAVLKCGIPFP
jgi:hypothetical protein